MKKYLVCKHSKVIFDKYKRSHYAGIAINNDLVPEVEAEFDTLSRAEAYFERCEAYIETRGFSSDCYGVYEYSLCIAKDDDIDMWAMRTI